MAVKRRLVVILDDFQHLAIIRQRQAVALALVFRQRSFAAPGAFAVDSDFNS
ncbi:MAG: hypothetical protein HXY23_14125, partial [Parvularculaceae bacterium]|nr:hypothetical protein [Parvularculaceae bacterium]